MRILYVLTSLGLGGAEKQVLALASQMHARGHSVCLLVLCGKVEHEWPTELPVVRLEMRRHVWSILRALAMGARRVRQIRPEIVHSHTFPANMAARLWRVLAGPYVLVATIHNIYEGGRLRMLAYRLTDGLCTRVTAVSHAAAKRFRALRAASHIVVVGNGIDIAEFAPGAKEVESSQGFLWLTAGRIAPAKDYPNLLRAFAQVRASIQDAQLWIAGEGRPLSRDCEGVRWLGARSDLPALMRVADGFVLSSAWEGLPLVVGEAMAMQRVVVATDAGGTREWMGPKERELLVSPGNSEALAVAMLRVMRMEESERVERGRSARARIVASASMETRVTEWETIYSELLAERRSSYS